MNAKELIDAGVKVGDSVYDCFSGLSVNRYKVISIMEEKQGIYVQNENTGTPYLITDTETSYALTKHQAVGIWIDTLHRWIAEAEQLRASL